MYCPKCRKPFHPEGETNACPDCGESKTQSDTDRKVESDRADYWKRVDAGRRSDKSD